MEAHQALRHALQRHYVIVCNMLAELAAGVDIEALVIDNELLHVFVGSDYEPTALELSDDERRNVAGYVLRDMRAVLGDALDDLGDSASSDHLDVGALSGRMRSLVEELAYCAPMSTHAHCTRVREVEAWLSDRPGVMKAMVEETSKSALDPFALLEALTDWMNGLDPLEQDDVLARFHDDPAETLREALQRAELCRELDDINPFDI